MDSSYRSRRQRAASVTGVSLARRLVKQLMRGLWAALTVGQALAGTADMVITHARVVSPRLRTVDDATIVVADGRIVRVGHSLPAPTARVLIDAQGRTVIPGLIDTHVHFNMGPFASEEDYLAWVATDAPARAREYVRHGFTTIPSCGDYWPGVLKLRDRLRQPDVIAPRMLISGPMITPRGGHGAVDYPACKSQPYCREHGWFAEVDIAEEGTALVDRLADAGVDGIKIAHDGTEFAYPSKLPMGHFRPGVLQAIISAAHRRGIPVRVHAYPVANALEAIAAGADGLAHGPGIIRTGGSSDRLDELLSTMASRGIGMSTTLGPQSYVTDPWGIERDVAFGTTDLVPLLKMAGAVQQALDDVVEFRRRGVVMAFGSDANLLQHPADAVTYELALLARSGLGQEAVLETATLNAARYLGRAATLGSIEPGKIADLVIVSRDPLRHPDFHERVDLVIREGRVIYDAAHD